MTTVTLLMRCVGCKHETSQDAAATDLPDFPMCEKCFSPMVCVKAVRA